jgi:hypothetical protein
LSISSVLALLCLPECVGVFPLALRFLTVPCTLNFCTHLIMSSLFG